MVDGVTISHLLQNLEVHVHWISCLWDPWLWFWRKYIVFRLYLPEIKIIGILLNLHKLHAAYCFFNHLLLAIMRETIIFIFFCVVHNVITNFEITQCLRGWCDNFTFAVFFSSKKYFVRHFPFFRKRISNRWYMMKNESHKIFGFLQNWHELLVNAYLWLTVSVRITRSQGPKLREGAMPRSTPSLNCESSGFFSFKQPPAAAVGETNVVAKAIDSPINHPSQTRGN
jgi:hypothetical protein